MSVPIKKVLLLLLLWSGFGFALNVYLDQKPLDTKDKGDAQDSKEIKSEPSAGEESTALAEDNLQIQTEPEIDTEIETELALVAEHRDPLTTINLDEKVLSITRSTPEVIYQNEWPKLVEQLVYNMRVNPNLSLAIIGYFDPSEPIVDPNLGIQRSVQVKNKLVTAGLSPDRISCRGDLLRLFDNNSMPPPIIIRPSEPLIEPSDIARVQGTTQDQKSFDKDAKGGSENTEQQSEVRKNPNLPKYNSLVYQPTFSDQGIVIEANLLNLLPGVQQWLDLDLKNYVEIVGHTDHVGHDQDNYRLALKWARQVRSFFIAKGIDPDRIKALSAGEQQPLYTNSSLRGREKNRRIELIFKF